MVLKEKKQKAMSSNLYHEILGNQEISHQFLDNTFIPEETGQNTNME